MRNIILALTLTLVTGNIFGQVEKPIYKVVADKFDSD